MSFRTTLFVGSALAFAGVSTAALAQQAPAPTALEEVVVTANKRSENLQEIPKQVTVTTSETLKQNNISNVNDLRKLVPSLTQGGAMRGVATAATTISANSKVGTVLDDIPIPTRATGVNNLLDIEQVEVLPGPQGTLAGRNATGGLINLVTRKPSRNSYTGIGQATATSDQEYVAGAYLSGPITDKLAFSLSSNYQRFRGLKYNLRDNTWASTDDQGLRGKLLWAPDDQTEITATLSYYREITKGANSGLVLSVLNPPTGLNSVTSTLDVQVPKRTYDQLFPGAIAHIGPDNNTYYSAFQAKQTRTNRTGVLRYERQFDAGTFTAIASIMRETAPQLQDTNTYTLINMNIRPEYDGNAHVGNFTDYKTAEFRFASKGGDKLTYLVGAFFSDNANGYDYLRMYQPVNWHRIFGQKNGAAFGNASYLFDTGTTVRAGLRYEYDYNEYLWEFRAIPLVIKTTENGTVLPAFPASPYVRRGSHSSDSYVNYDLGIQQKLGTEAMVYVTYGVASQGPIYDAEDNTVAIVKELTPLEPEKVKSLEAGLKSQWFDKRLTLNVNAFDSVYDNYQASTNVPDTLNPNSVPVLKLNSVGQVETKGVEINAAALLGDGFRLNFAALLDDATIKSWKNAPCYQLQSPTYGCLVGVPPPVPGQVAEKASRSYQPDLSGKYLAFSPKVKMTVQAAYEHELGFMDDLRYRASMTVRYASKQNGSLLQDPAKDIPATTFVDGQFALMKGELEVMLFVNNITKESAETFSTQLQPGMTNFPRSNTTGEYYVKIRDLDRNNNRYWGIRVKSQF